MPKVGIPKASKPVADEKSSPNASRVGRACVVLGGSSGTEKSFRDNAVASAMDGGAGALREGVNEGAGLQGAVWTSVVVAVVFAISRKSSNREEKGSEEAPDSQLARCVDVDGPSRQRVTDVGIFVKGGVVIVVDDDDDDADVVVVVPKTDVVVKSGS